MFTLFVQVEVRPELLDEFRTAMKANASKSVEREPECRRFDVYAVTGEPTRFVYHEVYTSEEAWKAHRDTPHFIEYDRLARRALTSRVVTRAEQL